MRIRRPLAALPLVAVALLAACAAPRTADAPEGSASAAAPASSAAPVAAGSTDVCALAPAAELEAVLGTAPGRGAAAKGRIDGGQCTWKVSDTHTALLQYTRQPDAYLPDSVWKRPKSAVDLAGVDRGWAAAATRTILVVKGGKGVLFTDITLKDGDQDAFTALGKAIAARL